jgi:hypothetical protein
MGVISDEVSGFFSIYLILPAALDPGLDTDTASNRNEYLESSW